MKNNKKNLLYFIIAILIFFVGYTQIKFIQLKKEALGVVDREQGGGYVMTNPILDFELSEMLSESVVSSGDVKKFVQSLQEKNSIDHVSVYFRDLNNGPWIGINEKEYFSPASMLKTPLIIALYKWFESDPSVLSRTVKAENRFFAGIPEQGIVAGEVVQKGDSYTLFELAKKMIQLSDNVATNILYEQIPKSFIDNTFLNIGIDLVERGDDMLLRIKDAASFYRVLFNASYLNRENSEAVLTILSKTEYTDGIVKGVPEEVVVAHKFGERFPADFLNASTEVKKQVLQLHDCGIVYYPKKPYILCVMTRGNDIEKQQDIIAQISQFFYNKIDKNKD